MAPELSTRFQVVLLALGDNQRLFPLTAAPSSSSSSSQNSSSEDSSSPPSSSSPVLLPVANRPLLSYSLRMVDACHVSSVILVAAGEALALHVSSWLAQEQAHLGGIAGAAVTGNSSGSGSSLLISGGSSGGGVGADKAAGPTAASAAAAAAAALEGPHLLHDVVVVPEGSGSADALRAVLKHTQSPEFQEKSSGTRTSGSGIVPSPRTPRKEAADINGSSAKFLSGGFQGGAVSESGSDGGPSDGKGRESEDGILVVDASVLCDINLGAVAAAHCRSGADATMVVVSQGGSDVEAAESGGGGSGGGKDKVKGGSGGGGGGSAHSGKKGSAAAVADIIGLDSQHGFRLLQFAPAPPPASGGAGTGKQGSGGKSSSGGGSGAGAAASATTVSVSEALLEEVGGLTLRSDLVDGRVYAFRRGALQQVLERRPQLVCLRRDVLPHLVSLQQQKMARSAKQQLQQRLLCLQQQLQPAQQQVVGTSPAPALDKGSTAEGRLSGGSESSVQGDVDQISTAAVGGPFCCIYLAPPGSFWRQIDSLAAYSEANHAVAGNETAMVRLAGVVPSSTHHNVVHETVTLGAKTTIGPHCMVGEGSSLGDKCSVKRSVVGRHCRLGTGVRISDSVVMDYVTLEDGCSVAGSVVCSYAAVREKASVKDCRVGTGFVVAADYKDADLVKRGD